jgi:hypothetical protein
MAHQWDQEIGLEDVPELELTELDKVGSIDRVNVNQFEQCIQLGNMYPAPNHDLIQWLSSDDATESYGFAVMLQTGSISISSHMGVAPPVLHLAFAKRMHIDGLVGWSCWLVLLVLLVGLVGLVGWLVGWLVGCILPVQLLTI